MCTLSNVVLHVQLHVHANGIVTASMTVLLLKITFYKTMHIHLYNLYTYMCLKSTRVKLTKNMLYIACDQHPFKTLKTHLEVFFSVFFYKSSVEKYT